jgi:glycerol-3-phosphate dehydrogenase
VSGPLPDVPDVPESDVDFLLAVGSSVLATPLRRADVLGAFAGLRPLVAGGAARSADLSRRHAVSRSPDGVVTVVGGKLTTYRRMAADTVDAAVATLPGPHGRKVRRSPTKHLRLRGSASYRDVADHHLAQRYGGEARTVLAMVAADPALGTPLVPGLPYIRAEAVYAARYEMARTLDDILSRRTRALLLGRAAAAAAAEDVAHLVANELGWDQGRIDDEVRSFRSRAEAEREAAGLPPVDAAWSDHSGPEEASA